MSDSRDKIEWFKRLSLSDRAKYSNASRKQWSRWLNGSAQPQLNTIAKYAPSFEMTPGELAQAIWEIQQEKAGNKIVENDH